jgi:hypothetical protein
MPKKDIDSDDIGTWFISSEKDTHSYKGWLNSDSFLKRALAVWGYILFVYLMFLIIMGVLWVIIFLIGIITGAA